MKINKSFGYGLMSGIAIMLFIASVPFSESAIPPTRAFQNIDVLTSLWAASDTLVESESSSDTVYFVTDGSITFNVTESYP